MTSSYVRALAIAGTLMTLNGCRVVGDIFKAGVWVGIVIVGLVVALLFGITRAFSTR